MSNETLTDLLDAQALDSSPLQIDMSAYHVPFDDRGRTGTESAAARVARSAERIGLVGPIGSGETGVPCYALDLAGSDIAPIWVPVAFVD